MSTTRSEEDDALAALQRLVPTLDRATFDALMHRFRAEMLAEPEGEPVFRFFSKPEGGSQ